MKKISVIIPVYNVEKYIDKCLTSLVNQTIDNFEIIVVNDGTKDNSQDIIDKYKKEYPKLIKSIIKENGGQGSARNVGLSVAKGEYIAYVDSDDYIEFDMLEKLYNNAKENNSDIVVCGNHLVTENYDLICDEVYKNDLKIFNVKSNPGILFDKMAVWNKIYKTSFLKTLNLEFRSKKWYEDFDFSTIVLLNAKRISLIEEPLYFYVLRQGSTMNNSNVKRNLEIIDAFNNILDYTKKYKLYKKYYEELEFLAISHIYLYAIVRIIKSKADKKEKIKNINKLKNYLKNNFENYKNNKYLKKFIGIKRKLIYFLINYNLYFLVDILFKFKDRKLG